MEIEIIGLVDVEVTPIRWNHDGTMFMDDTFRWYPADGPATVEGNGLPGGWVIGSSPIANVALSGSISDLKARFPKRFGADKIAAAKVLPTNTVRRCACGNVIPPTGKVGRPANKCPNCRNGK